MARTGVSTKWHNGTNVVVAIYAYADEGSGHTYGYDISSMASVPEFSPTFASKAEAEHAADRAMAGMGHKCNHNCSAEWASLPRS